MIAQVTAFKETEKQMINVFPNRIHRPVNKKENNRVFPEYTQLACVAGGISREYFVSTAKPLTRIMKLQEKCGIVDFLWRFRKQLAGNPASYTG